jgi:hypothetical protein
LAGPTLRPCSGTSEAICRAPRGRAERGFVPAISNLLEKLLRLQTDFPDAKQGQVRTLQAQHQDCIPMYSPKYLIY